MPFSLSIIIVNYNNFFGLQKTFNSLDLKNKLKVEYIFVDGGSTDGSLEFLKKKQSSSKQNLKLIYGPDNGIYDAFNKGIKKASFNYIAFLNSGDILADDNVLEKLFNTISENSIFDSYYGNVVIRLRYSNIVRVVNPGNFSRWKLLYGWMPSHQMFCIKKNYFNKFGFFDEKITIASDYDLLVRFFYFKKLTALHINYKFVEMEPVSTSGGSFLKMIKTNWQAMMAWKKYSRFFPIWLIISKPISKIFEFRVRS